ncbi:hypothetical protein [Arthrobacter methylotrophus]
MSPNDGTLLQMIICRRVPDIPAKDERASDQLPLGADVSEPVTMFRFVA